MDLIQIQAQDTTGNWRTYSRTQNSSQLILREMNNLKNNFPDRRIRAVDSNGRLVDIL